jgi:hypothetical protein
MVVLTGACAPPTPEEVLAEEAGAAMNTLLTSYESQVGFHHELSHWGLAGTGGEKLEWTADTAANMADFAFVLPAQEFVDAGVDPTLLVADGWIHDEEPMADPETPLLIRPYDLDATAAGPGDTTDSASAAFERLLTRFKDRLGYHEEMSHYGFSLGEGAKAEWTADSEMGAADLAFVFGAAEIEAAGADVALLEAAGWMSAAADGTTPALLIRPVSLD